MKQHSLLGVDIGGTKISMGKICNDKLVRDITFETHANESSDQIVNDIISGIRKLIDENVVGIGIGAPGLVDEEKGIVYGVRNIPSWKEIPLKYHLEKAFNVRVYISNDANCFALGEKIYGRGKNYKNMAGIVMGTGLGTGLIINNQLYGGMLSVAGEFGGIPYLGHDYEYYCSGKFFINNYNKSGKEFYKLALKGDVQALGVFHNFGQHIGNIIQAILYSVGPQAIFLGGSVSTSFEFFKDAMWNSIVQFPHKRITENLVIEKSRLENPGVLGAAALILNNDNLNSFKTLQNEEH